jgi:DNA-binding IclR family transcriptional regulator
MAGNSAEPGRSVTSKVVAILLTFHDGNEHSLTEIAQLTCLPISTTHRLVTELAGWGVLERTVDSRFCVGLPIKAMGGGRSYTPAIIESARRVLEDLVTAARTCARLGILTEGGVAYIEKRSDHSPVSTFAQTPRLPAYATALGKALLAFCPAGVVEGVIVGGLAAYTPSTLTDPERLRRCLASIRLTRVAISQWEFRTGESAVAVPVFGTGGTAVAALELIVPNLRADLSMASSVLTVAARGLSRELAAGRRVGCLSLTAEQQVAPRLRRPETDRKPVPALTASALRRPAAERPPRGRAVRTARPPTRGLGWRPGCTGGTATRSSRRTHDGHRKSPGCSRGGWRWRRPRRPGAARSRR